MQIEDKHIDIQPFFGVFPKGIPGNLTVRGSYEGVGSIHHRSVYMLEHNGTNVVVLVPDVVT